MTKSHDQLDLLHGSLWKTVPLFAMPVAATSILEQLSNFIGTLMIGHFSPDGGAIGMAAVGSNLPLTSLIIQFFVGISLGANVVIAYAVGSKDEDQASRCAHSAIALSLIGVIVAVVMEIFSRPILQCLGVPADAFEDACCSFAFTSSAFRLSCFTISKPLCTGASESHACPLSRWQFRP